MKIKNFFHIILLALIIFFLSKIPRYENTLLQLSENTKIERDYPIFNDDVNCTQNLGHKIGGAVFL